jgi:AcrR family transcriptional regulator
VIESTHTPDRIREAMTQLMRRQGYGATGVKDVTREAGATVGSVYHFFPEGKRQIAADALVASGGAYIALVPLLMDPHPNLGKAIRAFFAAAAEDIERADWATMCPVAAVGAETADVEPQLRDVCAGIVESWIDQATAYFRMRGLTPAAARELTLAALAALEGALVLARITHSTDSLHAAGHAVAGLADTMTSRRRR